VDLVQLETNTMNRRSFIKLAAPAVAIAPAALALQPLEDRIVSIDPLGQLKLGPVRIKKYEYMVYIYDLSKHTSEYSIKAHYGSLIDTFIFNSKQPTYHAVKRLDQLTGKSIPLLYLDMILHSSDNYDPVTYNLKPNRNKTPWTITWREILD
jgi:hypothetical protein